MSFQENQSSELFLELSIEQQETIAGGHSNENKETSYKTYEYKEHKTENGEEKEKDPFYIPPILWSPVTGITADLIGW